MEESYIIHRVGIEECRKCGIEPIARMVELADELREEILSYVGGDEVLKQCEISVKCRVYGTANPRG